MAAFASAFVTGASSGIGRAISLALAERGTRVVVAARRKDLLEALVHEITSRGGHADACVLDVSDTRATESAVRDWEQRVGGLDLVLANAGIDVAVRAPKMSWKSIEHVMGVNALGALATLTSAIEPMVARRRGTLAAVTSLAALRGLPGHAAYSASKACVSIFLEAIRAELLPQGVRVVDIRPGFVDTPMTRKNRFQMPFMMDVTDAARRSVAGLEHGTPVISYPWQLTNAMRVAEVMPDAIWRRVAPRLPR